MHKASKMGSGGRVKQKRSEAETPECHSNSDPGEKLSSDNNELGCQSDPKRPRLTSEQVQCLEEAFSKDVKLNSFRRESLATELGISERQVGVWFQNRKSRWKNKKLEDEHETLKREYNDLLKDHQEVSSDYDQLKYLYRELNSRFRLMEQQMVLVLSRLGNRSQPEETCQNMDASAATLDGKNEASGKIICNQMEDSPSNPVEINSYTHCSFDTCAESSSVQINDPDRDNFNSFNGVQSPPLGIPDVLSPLEIFCDTVGLGLDTTLDPVDTNPLHDEFGDRSFMIHPHDSSNF